MLSQIPVPYQVPYRTRYRHRIDFAYTFNNVLCFLCQIHEPPSVAKVREQAVRHGEGQDGGDAAAQHVLD